MKHPLFPRARKRFGQNFLIDQGVVDEIITAFNPQQADHVVEIGPGRGALTEPLLQHCQRLDVIELDRDLIPLLRTRLFNYPHLTIHAADALEFDFAQLVQDGPALRVIGNLPYNITTPLLFHLLEQAAVIEDMCFMLQKEVVERICAQPGTKQYGRLSIMMQYQCQPDYLFTVSPHAFEPMPKVESAIIYLRPLTKKIAPVSSQHLSKLVTMAFSQRRKTIANTLKKQVTTEMLHAAGIAPEQRPETVSVEQYVTLTQIWLTSHSPAS